MIVRGAHLGYCTNIHPGERWAQVRQNVAERVTAVKAEVAPEGAFGVGLRLSALAAAELAAPGELDAFKTLLEQERLYVFSINGFPYGTFAGTRVKEQVYRPDWLEEARLSYTDQLAHLLAALLPPGVEGSVSTVPGAFRERCGEGAAAEVADRLIRHAATLCEIRQRTGCTIALALEPEPGCLLETTAEAIALFQQHLHTASAAARLAALTGLARGECELSLRRHLGLCLDTCHAAVEFEDPDTAVEALAAAGVRIVKLQLSAGLQVARPDAEDLRALEAFAEEVYLHQVVVRTGQGLERHLDLPAALGRGPHGDEWRIHFHVPIFQAELGRFRSTQGFLARMLELQRARALSAHLEVETYTWDVLPPALRRTDVTESIARELRWVLGELGR